MSMREAKPDEKNFGSSSIQATTRKCGWWFFFLVCAFPGLKIETLGRASLLAFKEKEFWNP
jgi:hypothetical protein